MPDMENVIDGINKILEETDEYDGVLWDALALLKEQEERLRKLQKDKDKLCLEVSEWKHKFHDAPPKFVSQGVVDQIRWERDTALSQLEQIGKGLCSKMDDIVVLLKEQEAEWLEVDDKHDAFDCSNCGAMASRKCLYCPGCGAKMKNGTRSMEGR